MSDYSNRITATYPPTPSDLTSRIELASRAGHVITVTGPSAALIRSFVECTCGMERRHPSRHAANIAARAHLVTPIGRGRP